MTTERLIGTRYVVPLREGGSLPAVVETEDGRSFVVKFRGAGQGAKALVAEAIVAGLAQALDLTVPTPAIVELAEGFGNAEPDPEIQDILRGSVGPNFGLAYLPGALAFDPAVDRACPDGGGVDPDLAASIVWLDALTTNVDRSARNTNLLLAQARLWLIDHGAALYVHHRWEGWRDRIDSPFPQIKDHVLLPFAGDLEAADSRLRPRLTDEVIRAAVDDLPDDWLGGETLFPTLAEHRSAYLAYLSERLHGPRRWLQEAIDARARGPERLTVRQTHRFDVDD
jgi:hypothetical protein